MFRRDLLVRLFVPVHPQPDGSNGKVGTAYPVAPDLILTAAHVVFPDNRDESREIEARWEGSPDGPNTKGFYSLEKDPVVARHPKLDAVILRCARPKSLVKFGFGDLSLSRIPSRGLWSSAGYPDAGKRDDDRKAEGFHGTTHVMTEIDDHFDIDVEASPQLETDWHGASGMPIFLDDRNEILGIACEYQPKFDGNKLSAISGWRLLQDPDFQRHLEHPDREKQRATFVRDLATVLAKSAKAVAVIRDQRGLCENVDATPEAIADALARETDLEAASKGLRASYDTIRKERGLADNAELHLAEVTLVEAVQFLIPFHCEAHKIAHVRKQMVGPGAVLAEIDCAFEMVAEIYRAAAEGRRTDYRSRRHDTDYPEGKRSRPAPPIAGIADRDARLDAIRSDLSGKFLAGTWKSTRNRIDDIMIESLSRPAGGPPMSRQESIEDAAAELENLASEGRYYLTYRPPADEQARRELEEGLEKLSADYKSLVILQLMGGASVAREERRRFGPFNQMLPKDT